MEHWAKRLFVGFLKDGVSAELQADLQIFASQLSGILKEDVARKLKIWCWM